jgi:hypothetical protein
MAAFAERNIYDKTGGLAKINGLDLSLTPCFSGVFLWRTKAFNRFSGFRARQTAEAVKSQVHHRTPC